MSTKVPDGWLDYSPFGRPISNTQIIAVKTPLKAAFNNGILKAECLPYVRGVPYKGKVPKEEEFTPTQLATRLKEQFGKKLYAVIDLTYTSRYYSSKELTDLGVKHAKVKCPGHEIPSNNVFTRFAAILYDFLKECDEHSLVAVHCTHGLNRTGYMVCRYLIEEHELDPSSVIRDFAEARGYEIERQNYVEDLMGGFPRSRGRHGCGGKVPKGPSQPPPESSSHYPPHASHATPTYDHTYPGQYPEWTPDERFHDQPNSSHDWQKHYSHRTYSRISPYSCRESSWRPEDPRISRREHSWRGDPRNSPREHSWRLEDPRTRPREHSWRPEDPRTRPREHSWRPENPTVSRREHSWRGDSSSSWRHVVDPREYRLRTHDSGYSDGQQHRDQSYDQTRDNWREHRKGDY